MDSKNFKVVLDGKYYQNIPIYSNATIGEIKKHFNNFLSKLGRNPQLYKIHIFMDRNNSLDIESDTYDQISLSGMWGKITDGYILLKEKQIQRSLGFTGNRDVDEVILNKLDDYDLLHACQTNKYINESCSDDKFWQRRFKSRSPDAGKSKRAKPKDISWRDHYLNEITFGFEKDITRVNSLGIQPDPNSIKGTWIAIVTGYESRLVNRLTDSQGFIREGLEDDWNNISEFEKNEYDNNFEKYFSQEFNEERTETYNGLYIGDLVLKSITGLTPDNYDTKDEKERTDQQVSQLEKHFRRFFAGDKHGYKLEDALIYRSDKPLSTSDVRHTVGEAVTRLRELDYAEIYGSEKDGVYKYARFGDVELYFVEIDAESG